jgi:hypothetical protein
MITPLSFGNNTPRASPGKLRLFPCRFPAKLSSAAARGSEVFANTGIFAPGTGSKNFFPRFTLTAGKDE